MMLAVVMLAAMSITAFGAAENTIFSDVADDAWYADAVKYVRDNRLMSGTGPAAFEPERATSRVNAEHLNMLFGRNAS